MNGFLRIGESSVLEVLNKTHLLKHSKITKFNMEHPNAFASGMEFEYDPESFLYFRCRAISAEVPNKNGDYFDWDELKKAYTSFIGKGFYLNHDSDSPTKSKGIILDARLVDEGKYIETLVAVSRQIAPEICQLIEAGIIGHVSMGCYASRAKCSICSNEATNMETLCEHMNPQSAHYVKGRALNDGNRAFEYNYDISFNELSGVAIPADGEAHIFEVLAKLGKAGTIEEIKIRIAEINKLLAAIEE